MLSDTARKECQKMQSDLAAFGHSRPLLEYKEAMERDANHLRFVYSEMLNFLKVTSKHKSSALINFVTVPLNAP